MLKGKLSPYIFVLLSIIVLLSHLYHSNVESRSLTLINLLATIEKFCLYDTLSHLIKLNNCEIIGIPH